jgi:hypothetical protein
VQGSIALSLGLVMTGNAFLQGRSIGAFWPDASIFLFCRSVRFLTSEGAPPGIREKEIAPDPLAWLGDLKGDCEGFRLHVLARDPSPGSDRMGVGLVGLGPRWLVESAGGVQPRLWEDEWTFDDKPPEDRPWSVIYRATPFVHGQSVIGPPDLNRVEQDLGGALEAIARFAKKIGSEWLDHFRQALSCLEGSAADYVYHEDLAPPGFLPEQPLRILRACQAGWVFGGMGSWNDGAYGGDEEPEGDRLSDVLFRQLQEALVAVANSTFRPAA